MCSFFVFRNTLEIKKRNCRLKIATIENLQFCTAFKVFLVYLLH